MYFAEDSFHTRTFLTCSLQKWRSLEPGKVSRTIFLIYLSKKDSPLCWLNNWNVYLLLYRIKQAHLASEYSFCQYENRENMKYKQKRIIREKEMKQFW